METYACKSFTEILKKVAAQSQHVDSPQTTCLAKYLSELGVNSCAVEREYTDAGYLVDYANYYARCHVSYPRKTIRLHFFRLTEDQLSIHLHSAFHGESTLPLQAAYCGFVVLKPLPQTIVGRTCLSTYPSEDTDSKRSRVFPITRDYNINLHGIPLKVTSVAFQEQDSETAACATTAIWYALHGMHRKIATEEIPSPYEITNVGSSTYIKRSIDDVARRFPTAGLGLEQIEGYLRKFNLECIICGLRPGVANTRIREYLDSYLRAGCPVIVVGNMYVTQHEASDYTLRGFHAMTALGYADVNEFVSGSAALRIGRLFAHDDNVGPFTSFRFEQKDYDGVHIAPSQAQLQFPSVSKILTAVKATATGKTVDKQDVLANESGLSNEGITYRRIAPAYLVIPINPKVRVPLEVVITFAVQIYDAFERLKPSIYGSETNLPTMSWSCRLKDVSTMKDEVRRSKALSKNDDLTKFLTMPMPRYLWDVSFAEQGEDGRPATLLQILVDATDLLQGGGIVSLVIHESRDTAVALNACICRTVKDWVEKNSRLLEPEVIPFMRSLYLKTRR